jgi:hypothetical protein
MAKKITNPNPSPDTRFDGPRSNRNTKSNSKIRIQKSKLRATAEKLREIEPTALENIKKSVEGEKVESQQLDSSKWVVSSIIALDRAAASEEASLTKIRMEGKRSDDDEESEEQTPEQIKSEMKPRLSLVFVEPDEDE